jgi:hypothetical protein
MDRDQHRESLGEIKYRHVFITNCVDKIFKVVMKILFDVHLKDSCLWPSADVKPA